MPSVPSCCDRTGVFLRTQWCNYLHGGRVGYHATWRSADLSSASSAELQVLLGKISSEHHKAPTAAAYRGGLEDSSATNPRLVNVHGMPGHSRNILQVAPWPNG